MFLRPVGLISRTYRHMNRYRQILTVLLKYGAGELLDRFNVGHILKGGLRIFSWGQKKQVEKLTRSERTRMAVEELGPTFVKLAQILSTRPDLIPVEYAQELSKLQDQVPSFPFQQAREIVEGELKASLEMKFSRFGEIPLAAASIGQVHRARLQSGEEVAVKVQRPGIRKMVEVDLEILYYLATLIEKNVEELGIQKPTKIVEEFSRILEKEIDYRLEAANMERFARQFQENKAIYVPKVYRDLSSDRILTMEYMDGLKVSEIPAGGSNGLDRKIIASRGADLILEQVFRHGFFHADPHPGNIFILPGNVICFLDFGMMGSVDRQARIDLAEILYGYAQQDESKLAQALLKIVEWDVEPNRRALEKDLAELMGLYLYQPLKKLRLDRISKELIELITRHKLRLPPDTFLMIKALAMIEGVGLMLDPDFEMSEKIAPFIKRLRVERMHPQHVLRGFLDSAGDLVQMAKEIPGEMADILKQIKQGKVKIGFEHRGLENFTFHVDRSSNRIAISLIISSLIIGSSMILQTQIGPLLFGVPTLGVLGFSFAGVFGIALIISILRSGRL